VERAADRQALLRAVHGLAQGLRLRGRRHERAHDVKRELIELLAERRREVLLLRELRERPVDGGGDTDERPLTRGARVPWAPRANQLAGRRAARARRGRFRSGASLPAFAPGARRWPGTAHGRRAATARAARAPRRRRRRRARR